MNKELYSRKGTPTMQVFRFIETATPEQCRDIGFHISGRLKDMECDTTELNEALINLSLKVRLKAELARDDKIEANEERRRDRVDSRAEHRAAFNFERDCGADW